jgi:Capsule assembly protein Wzi/PAP2 superfamily
MLLGSAFGALLVTNSAPAAAFPQKVDQPTVLADSPRPQEDSTSKKINTSSSKNASITDQSSVTPPTWKRLRNDFLQDQKAIWTSPAKLTFDDTQWLVPIAGVTAGLMETDSYYSRGISHNPSTLNKYNTISNASLAALAGGAGGMWLMSYHTHNAHWRETGWLSGEAALNTLLVVEAMKYTTLRERPYFDNANGNFFQSGGVSFPSQHTAIAFAVAGVIAHEYPGPLPKIFAYGVAALVSYSRLRAQQHFPSDVFIGSIVGTMVAQQVYSSHHDDLLGGIAWKSYRETVSGESAKLPGNQGSPYVPLDSWVYPIFDRLIATGYVNTASLSQRPWSRLQCSRLLAEAFEVYEAKGSNAAWAESLLTDLTKEFSHDTELLGGGENRGAYLESAYTRLTGISGTPLTDSYHFGQTISDDEGRPYQEGFSSIVGSSGWVTAGRWVAYVRGEYQSSPGAPAYSDTVRNFIAEADNNPVQPANPIPSHSQFQPLDAYVGLTFSNWQLSYGQQSMWWGPGRMGPFLYSDNATPARIMQLKRVAPLRLPWLFKYMGPVYMDAFFGNLDGHQFPPNNNVFHGEKISFKPTENVEFGFSRTVILGGEGHPITPTTVWNSYVSVTSTAAIDPRTDPGKRTGGFDFSYRLPYLRNWVTLYCDSISDDDPSPIAAPRRAGINPGIFLPKLPFVNQLEIRLEAAYTDLAHTTVPGQFIYFDREYHDLYTNNGNIFGNSVGRDGKAYQAWGRYWLGPRSNIEFSYRRGQVSAEFVTGGGSTQDASVTASFWMHHTWNVNASVQYERWNFPILAPTAQVNVSTSVGFTYSPTGGKL